jgi:hypothetical protein
VPRIAESETFPRQDRIPRRRLGLYYRLTIRPRLG